MNDIIDPVRTKLSAVPGLSGKIFFAEVLKNAAPPFAFFESAAEETFQTLDGYTELESCTFNVHVVSTHYAELQTIAGGVRSSLIAMQGTETGGFLFERVNISQVSPILHEREVDLYRKVYNVKINYQQSGAAAN